MANQSTPLAAYLDAPVSQAKNVKRSGMKKKLWVGSLLLAFLPGLSTTLASSITINNSESIEFGQEVKPLQPVTIQLRLQSGPLGLKLTPFSQRQRLP